MRLMERFQKYIRTNLLKIVEVMADNLLDIVAHTSGETNNPSESIRELKSRFDTLGDDPRSWFNPFLWSIPSSSGDKGQNITSYCYKVRANSSTHRTARCITNTQSAFLKYLNTEAHTHIVRPHTILSLASAIIEMLNELHFGAEGMPEFYKELSNETKMLFSVETQFLQLVFDSEEGYDSVGMTTNSADNEAEVRLTEALEQIKNLRKKNKALLTTNESYEALFERQNAISPYPIDEQNLTDLLEQLNDESQIGEIDIFNGSFPETQSYFFDLLNKYNEDNWEVLIGSLRAGDEEAYRNNFLQHFILDEFQRISIDDYYNAGRSEVPENSERPALLSPEDWYDNLFALKKEIKL